VSRFLKERAEATFGITKPIEVIYNFVDPKVFVPRRESRIRFGGPGTKVLMHASNFRQVKNIPVVIQVFAEVRKRVRAKLVMVGDGPEKAGAEQLARELGVHRDVLFLGNQDLMEEMLSLADVFLLPSSSESFGLVALEAMSAEVPVVCSNAGGLPEVVEHGFTGFLHDPAPYHGPPRPPCRHRAVRGGGDDRAVCEGVRVPALIRPDPGRSVPIPSGAPCWGRRDASP
jgi:N-acetyl-alpha-D-glucosaminyl L-malate synthase BshA